MQGVRNGNSRLWAQVTRKQQVAFVDTGYDVKKDLLSAVSSTKYSEFRSHCKPLMFHRLGRLDGRNFRLFRLSACLQQNNLVCKVNANI